MKQDIDIAQEARIRPIVEIADKMGIPADDLELSSGAGFIVPIAGTIMRMPGLPVTPSAEKIDIDNRGKISGLF